MTNPRGIKMKLRKTLLAGALAIASSPAAFADAIGIVDGHAAALTANVTVGSGDASANRVFDFSTGGTSNVEGDTYQYSGSATNSAWDFGWMLQANADPFISGNLTFTNTTASTQTFNVVLALPTVNITGSVDETASLDFILSDANGDSSATLDFSQWHGLINPLPPVPTVLDLLLLGSSTYNCSGSGPGCLAIQSPLIASQTHSEIDHVGNSIDSIGIHIRFDLSAGDSVSLNTRWEVTPSPVPVPAAVWLFGSGLIGLFATARRKKA